jgi:hypothetical protein
MHTLRLRTLQMLAMTKYVIQQAAFERYFYGLALTALLGMGLSVVLSNLAVAGELEVLTHMTLSLTELFGIVIVLTMVPALDHRRHHQPSGLPALLQADAEVGLRDRHLAGPLRFHRPMHPGPCRD